MSRIMSKRIIMAAFLIGTFCLLLTGVSGAKEITDMMGRKVTVPDSVKKIYVPSPYGSYLMYSIDPAMLIGLNLSHNEDRRYLPKEARNLPVIGGLSGQGQQSNLELVLKAKPDLAIMWSAKKSAVQGRADEALKQLNLPLVYAVAESLNDYPDVYLFLGRLLNREERTKKLSTYCQKTLSDAKGIVSRIPKEKRPTVYYAEGVDGLSTECNDSIHVELLTIAGDTDVHRCHTASHQGMEKISLEKVMLYNPDVIVAQEKVFFDKVYDDPAWRNVKAVKNKKVYLIPRTPFNWFDRPPSFMRFLGLKWLMNLLYPNEYRIDIVKEARDFYSRFLGVEVSDREMKQIIYR
ncbi:MAG: Fe(3+)-citrate-binding protein YfmC precursor [Syntrophorhabdus sp. PtaU1.Bin002]|nr:MAG: Fe(3+)-citrate-binding protein YfmC precursor [Syntrophorhabdus sp. PtaB.Bin006]OPY73713.1 MAG: Fe(3+)-citrate-binding protein YfmC precursor [Syntrophorhabdus sp. PtaU1.Bin002]